MIKLSKAQTEVIKRLQVGERILYTSYNNSVCFYCGEDSKNISWATIGKLEILGLVSRITGSIELTEKGKEYK